MSYLKLLRVNVCLLAVLATMIGALISNVTSVNGMIFASIVAFLICGAGNVLNDYFDYDIDKINRPDRPIPSGKIKLKSALIYSIVLFLLGNLIAILFLNIYMIALALFNTLIIILYDWKIKRNPVGHFVDSYMGASPFIFGGLLSSTIMPQVIFLFLLGFFGNLSREIMKGIEDIAGDRKSGIKTLEISIGVKGAKIMAIMSLLISIALLPLPYLMKFVGIFYLPLMAISVILIAYALIKINDSKKSQKILKITMFVVLFAFLAGLL